MFNFINNIKSIFTSTPDIPRDYTPASRGIGDMISSVQDGYNEIRPDYPFEIIEIFKLLAFINPDVSQAVQKFVNLGNQGHSIEIKNSSDRVTESALKELNWLSKNGFGNAAGADGFINKQFRQIAITGALTQESVPNMLLSGIDETYSVKTSSIRFRIENNSFVPFQSVGIKNLDLNPETFIYIPLMSDEASPYALPPFSAALRFLLRQEAQWGEIDKFAELWGMLGYMHMSVAVDRGFNQLDEEFKRNASRELERYRDMFIKKKKNGIAVTGKNVDMKQMPVSKNAGQMDTVLQNTETMIASGMDIDPAMLGRSYSTTETYATVCYETLCGKLKNIQRLIKRGNEKTYNLHLTLKGIPAVCSMRFNSPPSLKAKEEKESAEINQRMIIERMKSGIISEDQAAVELGYESAYKKSKTDTVSFSYDKDKDKYVFNRPVIATRFKKKSNFLKLENDYISEFFEIYDEVCSSIYDNLEDALKKSDPVKAVMSLCEKKLSYELSDKCFDIAEKYNSESYYSQLDDSSGSGSFSFSNGIDFDGDNGEWKVTDENAIKWFVENDQYFFGRQYEHYTDDLKEVVVNELKGTERAYDKQVVERMKKKMGDVFDNPKVNNYYDLVVRNAVNRSRNYGRVRHYERIGVAEIEVVAVMDKKTSAICREMNGRRIKTQTAVDYVDECVKTPLNELTEKFAWPSSTQTKSFNGMSTDDIMKKIGCKLPPYHGRCRTTTVMGSFTRVKNSSGNVLDKIDFPKMKDLSDKVKKKRQKMVDKRFDDIKNLSKDELASKINSLQTCDWYDESKIPGHFAEHGNEVGAKSEKEYIKLSKEYLKNFDRVFIFSSYEKPRINFVNEKEGFYVGVDTFDHRITTFDILRKGKIESFENKFLELK